MENYCSPRSNEVLEAFRFLKLEYTQPFDNYLIELRRHAASCNYGDATDRMIRDKLVLSVKILKITIIRQNCGQIHSWEIVNFTKNGSKMEKINQKSVAM